LPEALFRGIWKRPTRFCPARLPVHPAISHAVLSIPAGFRSVLGSGLWASQKKSSLRFPRSIVTGPAHGKIFKGGWLGPEDVCPRAFGAFSEMGWATHAIGQQRAWQTESSVNHRLEPQSLFPTGPPINCPCATMVFLFSNQQTMCGPGKTADTERVFTFGKPTMIPRWALPGLSGPWQMHKGCKFCARALEKRALKDLGDGLSTHLRSGPVQRNRVSRVLRRIPIACKGLLSWAEGTVPIMLPFGFRNIAQLAGDLPRHSRRARILKPRRPLRTVLPAWETSV